MFYLVTYDIPSTESGDRRRAKVAKRLESYGLRVQFSVFEIEISPERLPKVLMEIEPLLDPATDSLRVYPFCGTCREKTLRLGIGAPCEHDTLMIW